MKREKKLHVMMMILKMHSYKHDGDVYDYGKSAHRLMVDGISDQCALQAEPNSAFAVYSISGKSRSAVATAGGKENHYGLIAKSYLTSSKAYFRHYRLGCNIKIKLMH